MIAELIRRCSRRGVVLHKDRLCLTVNPLRSEAAKAFDEFFFARARDVYPRHDFARMGDNEFGAPLGLD